MDFIENKSEHEIFIFKIKLHALITDSGESQGKRSGFIPLIFGLFTSILLYIKRDDIYAKLLTHNEFVEQSVTTDDIMVLHD